MSCEKNIARSGRATSKAGIAGSAARAAFYAGVGLAAAGAATGAYGLWRGQAERSYQQRVGEMVGVIQSGARLADQALKPTTPDESRQEMLTEAAYKLSEAWQQVKGLKDKDPLKDQLADFTTDVMTAITAAEDLVTRPGNVAVLDRVQKIFRGSQTVFFLPQRSRGAGWRTSLLIGGVTGLAAAGTAGLVRRQRARQRLENNHSNKANGKKQQPLQE